jgi:hypothetical protein
MLVRAAASRSESVGRIGSVPVNEDIGAGAIPLIDATNASPIATVCTVRPPSTL